MLAPSSLAKRFPKLGHLLQDPPYQCVPAFECRYLSHNIASFTPSHYARATKQGMPSYVTSERPQAPTSHEGAAPHMLADAALVDGAQKRHVQLHLRRTATGNAENRACSAQAPGSQRSAKACAAKTPGWLAAPPRAAPTSALRFALLERDMKQLSWMCLQDLMGTRT